MQQFFVDKLESPWLSADQRRQCQKVLRMRKGDAVRLVDPQGRGIVATFTNDDLSDLKQTDVITWPEKKRTLTLIAALIRTERLEWMIQKACEMGVDRIVLLRAEHGVVRDFGARSDRKMDRLNLIAKEACEQSYRQYQVPILGPIDADAIPDYRSDLNIYADIGNTPHLIEAIGEDVTSISAIVGPEGGFSKHERAQFAKLGFDEASLGDPVLRAETASLYICAMVSLSEVIK